MTPSIVEPVRTWAFVTGAGSGFGAGTARRFLEEGASVALNGQREHKLRETMAGFDPAKSLVHPGDVSDEEYVKRLVEDTVNKFGKLDVLVSNAAMAIFAPFAQGTTQDWRQMMATDLDSVLCYSRSIASSPENERFHHQGLVCIRFGWRLGAQFLQCGEGCHYQLDAFLGT